jgi:transcriptional regulator with XRE-family HTH domain
MVNGKQCRAARVWLGLSQEQLAEAIGVARRTIADLELEKRVPHDRTLRDVEAGMEKLGIEFLFEAKRGVGIRVRDPST